MKNIIYDLWFNVGCKMRFFKTYNIQRDKAMDNARTLLEEAFTPELKSMLGERFKDEE